MCDKLAISAYILKRVEKDPFLRLQMRAKETFNHHQFCHRTLTIYTFPIVGLLICFLGKRKKLPAEDC